MPALIDWQPARLQARLAEILPGLVVEIAACLASTNSTLLERARAAGPDDEATSASPFVRRSVESSAFARRTADRFPPCLLVAEHQTAGRGRQGRPWQSAAGASLTFSLALELSVADWSGLSLAVGVAVAEALDPARVGGATTIGLKWPNDLWLLASPPEGATAGGRKLGGVLIETVASGRSGRRVAVVGVGLNLARFELAGVVSTGLATLDEHAPAATPAEVLHRVAPALAEALRSFENAGFAGFGARFAARDLLRGQPVATSLTEASGGIARGVDASGALLIETADGAITALSSGEVSVRPAGVSGATVATAAEAAC